MARDHFVSQVHLKNFYAPALGGRKMYGFSKSSGKRFPCGSEDVCRIEEGSTNAFLPEPRLVEEFLKSVEPGYNAACTALRAGPILPGHVRVIAGFLSYVMTCSPGGMRLGTEPMNSRLKLEMALMEEAGLLSAPPPELPPALREMSIAQLLEEGHLLCETDPKYPQAIGIASLLRLLGFFGNCPWDILLNGHDDTPFFTSDFPVAVEATSDPMVANRVVPLTPRLAIRIHPRRVSPGSLPSHRDGSFADFRYRRREISRQEAMAVNRLIVGCAEDLVFSSLDRPWVGGFLERNAQFRLEAETSNLRYEGGGLSIARIVLRQRRAPVGA